MTPVKMISPFRRVSRVRCGVAAHILRTAVIVVQELHYYINKKRVYSSNGADTTQHTLYNM